MVVKWIIIQVLFCAIMVPQGGLAMLQIDSIRNDFLKLEDELWTFVLDYDEAKGPKKPEQHLMKKFQEFDSKVQQMQQDPLYGLSVSRKAFEFLELYTDVKKIHDLYEKFLICQKHYLADQVTDFKKEALMADIVDDVLNDQNNNVNSTTRRIVERIFNNEANSLLKEIQQITTDGEYMCKDYEQTPQQVFHHLFNMITLADLKGYILSQFSYLSEALYEEGNHTKLSLEARGEYKTRTQKYIVRFRGLMETTTSLNKLWRCDPKTHIQGETYEEITRLLQYHIENEADINSGRSCKQTCGDYSRVSQVYGCYDSASRYCQKRQFCGGRLLDCREASKTSVCITSGMRRYQYMKTNGGTVYGKESWCSSVLTPSWTRWFVYCSSCMCLCDEPGRRSDRFFNLRQVTSNVTDNRVVTGVRFVKKNRIIHMQIQEGKLLPYGSINRTTVRWVPLDDYYITDPFVKSGEDYHTMSFEEREMVLDDLQTHEEDYIITGVSFIVQGGILKLQVNVRKFNFETGILETTGHFINGGGSRIRLNSDNRDIPTLFPNTNFRFDNDLQLKFTHTGLYEDAGQTTVPFIDARPVATSPASPLRGVGVYWRGTSQSGGFVAPTITPFDFEKKMGVQIPEAPQREERKYSEVIIS